MVEVSSADRNGKRPKMPTFKNEINVGSLLGAIIIGAAAIIVNVVILLGALDTIRTNYENRISKLEVSDAVNSGWLKSLAQDFNDFKDKVIAWREDRTAKMEDITNAATRADGKADNLATVFQDYKERTDPRLTAVEGRLGFLDLAYRNIQDAYARVEACLKTHRLACPEE